MISSPFLFSFEGTDKVPFIGTNLPPSATQLKTISLPACYGKYISHNLRNYLRTYAA